MLWFLVACGALAAAAFVIAILTHRPGGNPMANDPKNPDPKPTQGNPPAGAAIDINGILDFIQMLLNFFRPRMQAAGGEEAAATHPDPAVSSCAVVCAQAESLRVAVEHHRACEQHAH